MSKTSQGSFAGSIEQYLDVLEEMEDIILIIDESGKIDYVNRALRKLLKFKKKHFTGKKIFDISLFDEDLSKDEIIDMIFSKKAFITYAKNSVDDPLHLSWRSKVFKDKKKKKVLAIIRDLSSQITLQKKFEEYNENLQEMIFQRTQQLEKEKQKAEELHKAKAIFISKMSHEIRTPLTAIRGYAELLKEPNINKSDRLKYLSVIERNAEGLLEMVVQTLDMVQIEQDKYQIREQLFDLEPLLHDIVDTFSAMASERGLDLNFSMNKDIPKNIYSDPVAIRQILINLISNAIKFTEKGHIKVFVKLRSLRGHGLKKMYFYVEDTGVGVPKEHKYRIFKSFEQYLDNQSAFGRGTGLGLSICKQLAKLLGGDVKLHSSDESKGSVFVFSLPVRKKPALI